MTENFLDAVLRGFITYSVEIYVLLGIGILVYMRKFIIGLREWQKSAFGLEREFARRKLVSASTGLVLLTMLIVGEFLLVTILGPQMTAASTDITPAKDPSATQTATLSVDDDNSTGTLPTATGIQESLVSECVEDVLEITSPAEGEEISGTVELFGSVNVENFGSYKYEYSSIGTINWITIAAGDKLKLDENLGFWYTSALTPGSYLLKLVPVDNTGQDMIPCIIRVEVVPEE
jgi:hypothetical protein